jgi:REP element-mobilizing transposase RayT
VCEILVSARRNASAVYGWMVGRYVVMPDHVHFFAAPSSEHAKTVSAFVGGWKNWTRRRIRSSVLPSFAWQREFFDHLMRSGESYSDKWGYIRLNPVRPGLVAEPQDWPYQGEIYGLFW